MNQRLNRHIQDTADTLQLTKSQAEYLKSCMQIAFHLGERAEMEEEAKRLNVRADKEIQEKI